jgi:hypothetical protein
MKMKRNMSLAVRASVVVASVACLASTTQAAITYSDNFSVDTLPTYSLHGGSSVTYSPTAGVGGGGGLVIGPGSNDSTSLIPGNPTNTAYTVEAGASVTISMMLKLNAGGFGPGGSKAFMGLATGPNTAWGQNAPPNSTYFGGVAENAVNLGTRAAVNGGPGPNSNTGAAGSGDLTGGNWYLFSATLDKPTSGTTWTSNGFLQDYGADGQTAGSVVRTWSQSRDLTGDSYLSVAETPTYLNFGVRNQSWSAIDNFNVTTALVAVPEPGTLGLVAAGSLLALRRRRQA